MALDITGARNTKWGSAWGVAWCTEGTETDERQNNGKQRGIEKVQAEYPIVRTFWEEPRCLIHRIQE